MDGTGAKDKNSSEVVSISRGETHQPIHNNQKIRQASGGTTRREASRRRITRQEGRGEQCKTSDGRQHPVSAERGGADNARSLVVDSFWRWREGVHSRCPQNHTSKSYLKSCKKTLGKLVFLRRFLHDLRHALMYDKSYLFKELFVVPKVTIKYQ
jgi:hypothetical protein